MYEKDYVVTTSLLLKHTNSSEFQEFPTLIESGVNIGYRL